MVQWMTAVPQKHVEDEEEGFVSKEMMTTARKTFWKTGERGMRGLSHVDLELGSREPSQDVCRRRRLRGHGSAAGLEATDRGLSSANDGDRFVAWPGGWVGKDNGDL